jgi:hypothetical protein
MVQGGILELLVGRLPLTLGRCFSSPRPLLSVVATHLQHREGASRGANEGVIWSRGPVATARRLQLRRGHCVRLRRNASARLEKRFSLRKNTNPKYPISPAHAPLPKLVANIVRKRG